MRKINKYIPTDIFGFIVIVIIIILIFVTVKFVLVSNNLV